MSRTPERPRDRAGLLAFIAADAVLAVLREEAAARDAASPDAAHDLEHSLRVALWTLRCGPGLPARLAVATALLHDAVRVPKDHPDRPLAGERSAAHARGRMLALGFTAGESEAAAEAIRDHGFSRGAEPEGLLGRALQDADRLDALGAVGIARLFATGAAMGASFFDPDDPWARRRALDDHAWSVDHFFAKLLRLRGTMRTEAGRREAGARARLMRGFLAALGRELDEPPPELSGRK
jgi:uncharacterized protein